MPKKINEVLTQVSDAQHARMKNAATGSHKLVEVKDLSFDLNLGFFKDKKGVKLVPAVNKYIDEAVVNAIDHFINCLTKTTINQEIGDQKNILMNKLEISLSADNVISIKNNGYGIPVEFVKPDIYAAEFIYLHEKTSTNYDQSVANRITGGTNGMGAKLIVNNSSLFKYEGQDASQKLAFVVEVDNEGKKTMRSRVVSSRDPGDQYTNIQFLLDWSITGYKSYSRANLFRVLFEQIMKRCVLANAFMNCYGRCQVIFNSKLVGHTIEKLAEMAKLSDISVVTIEQSAQYYNENQAAFRKFKLVLGINEYAKKNHIQVSIVNGVEVTKNPIIDFILKNIYGRIKEKMEKNSKIKIQFASFKNRITAFFVGVIGDPEWSSQIKDEFSVQPEYLAKLKYDIKDIAEKYAKRLSDYFILDQVKAPTRQVSSEKYDTSIHRPPDNWRARKHPRWLIITEGNSASTLVNRILSQKGMLNMDNTGILSLKGVPMNTYHRMTIKNLSDCKGISEEFADKRMILMDEICQQNNEINVLLRVAMGVHLNNPDVMSTMRYDYYVIASDQDLDGWNINGLLLVFFTKFRELFDNKRIFRLQTPIARVLPEKLTAKNAHTAIEFITPKHLEDWLSKNQVPPGHVIGHYKGLGSNEVEFAPVFAKNIGRYLYTFEYDDKCDETLARFYDKENPDLRKQELSTPIRQITDQEREKLGKRIFTISFFLDMFVKQYQLYNLGRKLLNVIGGQNRVTNKILHSLDKIFGGEKTLKVALAGNSVIKHTKYQHGEKSVYDAIFNQTQLFPGSTNLFAMTTGVGEFGTKLGGGKDHADPRYVSLKFNKKFKHLLYRPEDECILEYQYEENQRIDPKYQLPVLPIVLFRNYKTTAHGWQIQIWARDVSMTVGSLIHMINGGRVNAELPMNRKNIGCNFITRVVDHVEKTYARGKYTISGDSLFITELPFGVWNESYKDMIESRAKENENMKNVFGEFIDKSSVESDHVDIRIDLKKDWAKHIPKKEDAVFSDIELFFRLRVRIVDELNLLSENGTVIEFDSYIAILKYWFEFRKAHYQKRIERQIEIMKNRILVQENICRYLANFKQWGLSDPKITKKQSQDIFEKHGLAKINPALVSPSSEVELRHVCKFLLVSKTKAELEPDEIPIFDKFRELKVISGFASYEYLNSIRTDQLRDEKLTKKLEELADLKQKLAELQVPDVWRSTWLAEIAELRPYMIGSGQ